MKKNYQFRKKFMKFEESSSNLKKMFIEPKSDHRFLQIVH